MSESTDDNELKEFDLGAWEAPEPPEDLADVVIARLGGTEVGAAVPVEEPRLRHRALLVGGVAAAILALSFGGYALVRNAKHVAPVAGSVTADRAQALALDGARADLDPGAEVKWSRQGRVLHVEQRKGTATWRVDADEQLVIDAGAMVASVAASGASLRVEVQMNPTETRIMGAAAVTAAAVAMVTVVVYEGHVKVRDTALQREYVVEPGSRYTVTPPAPVVPVASEPAVVGVGPVAPGGTIADVMIDPGATVTIHDPSPPTTVQFNVAFTCMHAAKIDIDGSASTHGVARLAPGTYAYRVECDGHDAGKGRVVVVRDSLTRPLPKPPATNDDTASLFDIESPEQNDTWGDQLPIRGFATPGATLSIDGIDVPLGPGGRFMTTIPATGRSSVPLRLEHPYTGVHYAILRSHLAEVTVASSTCDEVSCVLNNYDSACCAKFKKGGADTQKALPVPALDRSQISTAIHAVRGQIEACGKAHPASGILKVNVAVDAKGEVSKVDVAHGLEPGLDECVRQVLLTAAFPKIGAVAAFSYPFVFSSGGTAASPPMLANCDATTLKTEGDDAMALGQFAVALARYEASLRCKVDPAVIRLAFAASCDASNSVKATFYYGKLSPQEQKTFAQLCIRNKIDPTKGAQPICDAAALQDKGMEDVNAGQHAAALAQFEASLRCKQDGYVVSLAFMSACNAQDSPKARLYYKQLPKDLRSKLSVLCVRNKTSYEDTAPPAGSNGYLQLSTKPAAKVFIDGADTGLTTPVNGHELPLSPGRHKITVVVGDDRFTYPVTVRAGETEVLSKDLQ